MLGQKQVDATDLACQFGYFAQNNKWGPIVAVDDEIDPNGAVGLYAARKQFVKEHHDALVRFAMAYLQGVKEFNAAAVAPDKHPDMVVMLAKRTALQKPEVVRTIAPHWSYSNEDGVPHYRRFFFAALRARLAFGLDAAALRGGMIGSSTKFSRPSPR